MQPASTPYPATFTVTTPEHLANWRPLVQWLLAIPHFIVLYVLGVVSGVVGFISWVIILFTGKLPPGLAGFQSLYLRYTERANGYAGFLFDEYPPFGFDATPADPHDLEPVLVEFRPELEDRNRLTTFFRWVLAIPHYIVLAVLGLVAAVAWIIAFFAVLFTGRWPTGLHDFVVGYVRWTVRVTAYSLLLTDRYPPFSLQ